VPAGRRFLVTPDVQMAGLTGISVGIGSAFTSSSSTILAVGVGGIASFVVVFAAVVCRQTNEVVIARRCVRTRRVVASGGIVTMVQVGAQCKVTG
jgi:hypothetical protein